jgi:hypothetical protein
MTEHILLAASLGANIVFAVLVAALMRIAR